MCDHTVFALTGTSVQASSQHDKTCLDLLLVSDDNILKKKDANV